MTKKNNEKRVQSPLDPFLPLKKKMGKFSFTNPSLAKQLQLFGYALNHYRYRSDHSMPDVSDQDHSMPDVNNSDTSTTSPSTSNVNVNGILEDHPGLNPNNPSSEKIVELHAEIRNKIDEVIDKAGHPNLFTEEHDRIALAEKLHGESENVAFLKSIIDDLGRNGPNASEYKEALNLADLLSLSPLDPFSTDPVLYRFYADSLFILE
jgi:hypothetical protein